MPLSDERNRVMRRLHRRKSREREGLVLVEGLRACREALAAGASIRWVVCSPGLRGRADAEVLIRAFEDAGTELVWVANAELAAVADAESPQGILAVARQPEDVAARLVRSAGRILLLDGVQDPGNVGTLVRVAAAFGLDLVVALDGTADPWSAKAVRGSAGTCFRVPVTQARWTTVRSSLEEAGVPLLLASAEGVDVESLAVPAAWALAIGSEAHGVRDGLRSFAHATVAVPMPGGVESLNAGVAGAILLYVLTGNVAHV